MREASAEGLLQSALAPRQGSAIARRSAPGAGENPVGRNRARCGRERPRFRRCWCRWCARRDAERALRCACPFHRWEYEPATCAGAACAYCPPPIGRRLRLVGAYGTPRSINVDHARAAEPPVDGLRRAIQAPGGGGTLICRTGATRSSHAVRIIALFSAGILVYI